MSETLEVHIDYEGRTSLVGRCHYLARPTARSSIFEYALEWLDRPNAFALDPANLPLGRLPAYTHSGKSGQPGALRDTAPDRWGQLLIERAFRREGREGALSEIDHLLGLTDRTRVGALRCRREGEDGFDHNVGRFRIPPLVRLPALINAADAVHGDSETAADLRLLLNEGSPIGGARPKSAIADEDGTPAIAKFPKPDDTRDIPAGEILAMTLARNAGIKTAGARLVTAAGRRVALIARFDRRDGRRIPFLSAMSLLGIEDGDEGAYTDICECIRRFSSAPTEDLHELWRRVVFNVMAGNVDDHLRNHGFLYDRDGMWRLSPAYDLNPVPTTAKARELATWISEEGPEADLDQARRAARFFALDGSQAEGIIREVAAALKDWRNVARRIGMSGRDVEAYETAIRTDP